MIVKAQALEDLIKVLENFLSIELNNLDMSKYPNAIPKGLKILYAIKEKLNQSASSIKLFETQDTLIPWTKLDLTRERFLFLIENQYAWTCWATLNKASSKVYNEQGTIIAESLDLFLVSYTLYELTFTLAYNLADISFDEIKLAFNKIVPLWLSESYVSPNWQISFYQIDEDCIFMDLGENGGFFATQKEERYQYFLDILRSQ